MSEPPPPAPAIATVMRRRIAWPVSPKSSTCRAKRPSAGFRLERLRSQVAEMRPDHPHRFKAHRRGVGQPDLSCRAGLAEHEAGDGPAVRHVEQMRVHALVAVEIVGAEADAVVGERVAVCPEQAQALVVADPGRARDGACGDRAIGAAAARSEVFVGDRHDAPDQQAPAVADVVQAGEQEGGVFVVVWSEQPLVQRAVVALGDRRGPGHRGFRSQAMTLAKREARLSPVRIWRLLSEICVRSLPSICTCGWIGPYWVPSIRCKARRGVEGIGLGVREGRLELDREVDPLGVPAVADADARERHPDLPVGQLLRHHLAVFVGRPEVGDGIGDHAPASPRRGRGSRRR